MGVSLSGAYKSFQQVKVGVPFTGTSDPLFSSVALLIQPESGDSSIEDKGPSGHTFTINGSPTLSSTTVFGGQSIDFSDGDNLHFTTEPANLQSWNDSDVDYTWEYIIQFKSLGRGDSIWGHTHDFANNDFYQLIKNSNNGFQAQLRNGSNNFLLAQTADNFFTSGNIGDWWHIAITKEADTWRVFFDGVLTVSDTTSARFSSFEQGPRLGRTDIDFGSGSNIAAYLRSARLTEGTARYTSNFTPPSDVFPTN